MAKQVLLLLCFLALSVSQAGLNETQSLVANSVGSFTVSCSDGRTENEVSQSRIHRNEICQDVPDQETWERSITDQLRNKKLKIKYKKLNVDPFFVVLSTSEDYPEIIKAEELNAPGQVFQESSLVRDRLDSACGETVDLPGHWLRLTWEVTQSNESSLDYYIPLSNELFHSRRLLGFICSWTERDSVLFPRRHDALIEIVIN